MRKIKLLLFTIILFTLIQVQQSQILCTPVFITLSPLNSEKHYLELNWDFECGHSPEWVGLYNVDPNVNDVEPLKKIYVKNYPKNVHLTNVYLNKTLYKNFNFPGGWDKPIKSTSIPGPHCLPFWIASFNKCTLLKSNCFKIQPTWMHDNREYIGNIPLSTLLIPGTHLSGADDKPRGVFTRKHLEYQNQNIYTQLVFGIRYFDFYAGYERNGNVGTLYINQDEYKIHTLLTLIEEIKEFIRRSPKEIIILDFHKFRNFFNDNIYRFLTIRMLDALGRNKVVQYTNNKFSSLGPTANDLWKLRKNIIVCYNLNPQMDDKKLVWPQLKQFSIDTDNLRDLQFYMENSVFNLPHHKKSQRNPFWSIIAVLTPKKKSAITFEEDEVRKMSNRLSKNVTNWVKHHWWKKCNAIATDFFLSNNIIELSILALKMKSLDKETDKYCRSLDQDDDLHVCKRIAY